MNTTTGMQQLSEMFKGKDWFHDVGTDQYKRLVVYIKYSCEENLRGIPDKVEGIQVLVHFAGSVTARREDFTTITPTSSLLNLGSRIQDLYEPKRDNLPIPLVSDISQEAEYLGGSEEDMEELPSSFLTPDIGELARELDRLERLCGSNTLQDIFYEIHDGKNSVTNLSARHPDVCKSLERLYEEYGFDVIYEEMDG